MSNGLTIDTLITVPFVWYIIEVLGRRLTLIIGCSICFLGGVLQGVSQNFSMFVASRIG
jgi:predicted MFS family arabinose efflux permease